MRASKSFSNESTRHRGMACLWGLISRQRSPTAKSREITAQTIWLLVFVCLETVRLSALMK